MRRQYRATEDEVWVLRIPFLKVSVSNVCHEQSLTAHCDKDMKKHLSAPSILPTLTLPK